MSRSLFLAPLLVLAACGDLTSSSPSGPAAVDPDQGDATTELPSSEIGAASQSSTSGTTAATATIGSARSTMSSSRFQLSGALRASND